MLRNGASTIILNITFSTMRKVLLNVCILFACSISANAQISLSAGTTISETFNAMTTGTSLPAHWQMSPAGGGAAATFQNPATTNFTAVSEVANSGSPITAGRYNWGNNAGADRAIGFMTSGSYVSPNAIMAWYQNNSGATVTSLTVTFQIERYRVNTFSFFSTFWDSPNGSTWTARTGGDISPAVFQTGASAYNFVYPQTVYKSVTITGLSIANGGNYYLRWIFNNADNTNSQGLGLDNVGVSINTTTGPTVTAALTDALTIDNNSNTKANEGDKLTYTATIKNTGTNATQSNTTYNAPLDPNTTLSGAVKSSALANDDNYSIAMSSSLGTDASTGVLANDFGLPSKTVVSFGPSDNPAAVAVGGSSLSDNGAIIQVSANGSLSYVPLVGFVGYDKFSYMVQGGVAPNDIGIVTIAVGNTATAANDAYSAIGNVSITLTSAGGVIQSGSGGGPDAGNSIAIASVNGSLASVGVPITTSNGGNLTLNADGNFFYNPAPGFTGNDQFTYTVDNGFSSPSAPATVTVGVTGMIWFVDANSGTNGDGRLLSPFNSLPNFVSGAADDPGDNIFLYESGTAYNNGLNLLSNQKLIGQDATASLSTITGLTPPSYSPAFPVMNSGNATLTNLTTTAASTNAVVTNNVATSNLVRGLTIGNKTGAGINGSGFGTLTVLDVSVTGTGQALSLSNGTVNAAFNTLSSSSSATNGVSLTGLSGSLTATAGAITGSTAVAFDVNGGNVNITYPGTLSQTASANVVNVANRASGNITFSGDITVTAPGRGIAVLTNTGGTVTFSGASKSLTTDANSAVTLSGNAGATINFTNGGLVVNTTTGTGFNAQNGGTVTVSVDGGATNSITTVSGTGLSMIGAASVNAGAAGITFASIISTSGSVATIQSSAGTKTLGRISTSTSGTHALFMNDAGTLNIGSASAPSSLTSGGGANYVVYVRLTTVNITGTPVNKLNVTGTGSTPGVSVESTVAITGGNLAIATAGGIGLKADLGGTITVSGSGNTISSTTGTALNVVSTTIGASGLTFQSISANGAVNGIVLNNTGSGRLIVAGDGNTSVGGNSSGGTIQNTTGHAISLTTTNNPSFTNINIQSSGRSGIDGNGVTSFTLANSTINNVGTAAAGQYDESNISFNDGGVFTSSAISGAISITQNILNNARRHGIQIENGTGTISNLTITNNSLTSSTNPTVSLGTGILILVQGSAASNAHLTTGNISNNTVTYFPSTEGIFVGGGSGSGTNNTSSTLGANGTPITISGNTIGGTATQRMGSNAIRASMNGQFGVMNFTITNNNCSYHEGQGISYFIGGTITGTATISSNTIAAHQTLLAGTQGLAVQVDDGPAGLGTSAANYNVTINSNNVSFYEGNGIRAISRASNGFMDLTIQNNTVTAPIMANRNGIRVDCGSAAGDVGLCLLMTGNSSAGSGVNQGIGIRKQGTVSTTNDFGIVGLVPSPATAVTAAAKIVANNPSGNGCDVISGDNFTSCTQN
jgi:hypothetical protein